LDTCLNNKSKVSWLINFLNNTKKKVSKKMVSSKEEDDFFAVKKKEKISEEELNELFRNIRTRDRFPMEETKTRNVLIVGRTRSGKSTAVGVMKDPCFEPKDMSIFSDTVNPKFQSFSLDDKNNQMKYTLNIIDTPGLKEVAKIGEDARSDEVILNTINYCLKNEITKINTLLIFISFELGVTSDDLNSFQSFLEKFSHNSIQIGICITRSEDKGDKWKKGIVEQLSQHAYFSEVLKKDNVKVLFMGCVDSIKNETMSHIDDAKDLYVKVYRMREELIKYIFSSENQVMLIDLPIAAGVKTEMRELFKLQHTIMDYLENVTDFSLGTVQNRIDDFAMNIDAIAEKDAILLEGEMHSLFSEMKNRMQKIHDKIPDEKIKAKFRGKLILAEK